MEKFSTQRVRSKIAGKLFNILLLSPFSNFIEKIFVSLGHRFPKMLLASGTIIEQLYKHHETNELEALLQNGVKISLPSTKDGHYLYLFGCWPFEDETQKLVQRYISDGSVFFDIGAHFGLYTFLAAPLIGSSGHIYSFEPQSLLCHHMNKTCITNKYSDRITIECAAVTDQHHSNVMLYYDNENMDLELTSIFQHEWLDTMSGVNVQTIAIDQYAIEKNIEHIDIMKIDVEGAEIQVLSGMNKLLKENPPSLIIAEVLPTQVYLSDSNGLNADVHAAKPIDVINFLCKFDYEPRSIQEDGYFGSIFNVDSLKCLKLASNVAFVSKKIKQNRPQLFRQ